MLLIKLLFKLSLYLKLFKYFLFIIQKHDSNLNHPGKPQLDANIKTAEETLTEDDYRNTDLFEIKCHLSGLID